MSEKAIRDEWRVKLEEIGTKALAEEDLERFTAVVGLIAQVGDGDDVRKVAREVARDLVRAEVDRAVDDIRSYVMCWAENAARRELSKASTETTPPGLTSP